MSAAYTWAELEQALADGKVTDDHVRAGLVLLQAELTDVRSQVADLEKRVSAFDARVVRLER